MSATANWSYTNTAKIKPFISINLMTGVSTYGAEYDIACTWEANIDISKTEKNEKNEEFVIKNLIYTERAGIKRLDKILLNGHSEWQDILSVKEWDMSFFGESPDYLLVT